jgi:hypothetical protein
MKMRDFVKKYHNPMFWLGADVVLLVWIISDFLEGQASVKETGIMGVIFILLIGLNQMDVEKEKEKEQ